MDENQKAIQAEQEDIAALLARDTADGPGDLDKLPEEDFVSFSEDDVEESK